MIKKIVLLLILDISILIKLSSQINNKIYSFNTCSFKEIELKLKSTWVKDVLKLKYFTNQNYNDSIIADYYLLKFQNNEIFNIIVLTKKTKKRNISQNQFENYKKLKSYIDDDCYVSIIESKFCNKNCIKFYSDYELLKEIDNNYPVYFAYVKITCED